MQEIQLGFIVCRANGQFDFDMPANLLGFNLDDTNAGRQSVLKVHEHLRPVETAGIDDAVDESGAVMEAGDIFLFEIAVQFLALGLVLGKLLVHFFRAGANFSGCTADGVDVPREHKKNNGRSENGDASTGKEAAAPFPPLGFYLESDSPVPPLSPPLTYPSP